MAKKPAGKPVKTMSKKGMKKTKGGLIGLLKPATINGNLITGNTLNTVNGDNKLNGDGITGNTLNGGTINF